MLVIDNLTLEQRTTLGKQFIKDNKLHMTITDIGSVLFRQQLINPPSPSNAEDLFNQYMEIVSLFPDTDAFLHFYTLISEAYISEFKTGVLTGDVSKFINGTQQEFETFLVHKDTVLPASRKGNVYHPDNLGHLFLSVDLASANFQALSKYVPAMVFNKSTYSEFLAEVFQLAGVKNPEYANILNNSCVFSYFVNCKALRAKLFGMLSCVSKSCTNRLESLEKDLMSAVYLKMKDFGFPSKGVLVLQNKDELLFDLEHIDKAELQQIQGLLQSYGVSVHINAYKLMRVSEYTMTSKGKMMYHGINAYVKQDCFSNSFELACCVADYYRTIYAFYANTPLAPWDCCIEQKDGHKAYKLIEPLEFAIIRES